MPISTVNCGAARRGDSTQARAGAWPAGTQASHTAFISAKSSMLFSQIVADSACSLSLPASASRASMRDRMSLVCSATLLPPAPWATWPAR